MEPRNPKSAPDTCETRDGGHFFEHIVCEGTRCRRGAERGASGKRASTLRLVAYVLAQVDRGERPSQHVLSLARDFLAAELDAYR